MPKARTPRAGIASSSGVRLSSTREPSPTASSAPKASRVSASFRRPRSGSRALMASAASGTRTSSGLSGACGARRRTIARYSQTATSMNSAMSRKKPAGGRRKRAARMSGVATAAVRSRCIGAGAARRDGSALPLAGEEEVPAPGLGHATVAALPALVGQDRLEQVLAPEVGPQGLRHPDLRVGDLPEQEVADAQLAGGADEEVGVGLAGGVEVPPD